MKSVILAGGFGTRLSEETVSRPKPMVTIGDRPILHHIMDQLSSYGLDEFCVACGYKGDHIKRYFAEYNYYGANFSVRLAEGRAVVSDLNAPDWTVHCIDTGLNAMTGGRLKVLADRLSDGPFLCTYGDGLSDVNIEELISFHKSHGLIATVTAVHPPARFGLLDLDGDMVSRFAEKRQTNADWINGGFFIFEPEIFDFIAGPQSSLEFDVLEEVSRRGQLAAFRHHGFFQPMDTLREKRLLEELWEAGKAPWAAGRCAT